MKQIKILIIAGFLLSFSSNAHALDLSRVKTWAASEILTAADLNGEFNNILNHSLTNNDIDAAAGIVGSKLNLSAPGIIGATTAAAGTFTTLNATGAVTVDSTSIFKDKMSFTQIDNLEYIDSLLDGELDFEATTSLNLRINAVEQVQVFDGKIAPTTDDDIDLGDVTHEFKDAFFDGTVNIDSLVADTADINGGTMDSVQIGGATATGELFVNNATDDAAPLGSQGTAGQILESQGAGVNPQFITPPMITQTSVSWTTAGLSDDIPITQGKRYLVFLRITAVSQDQTFYLRFNSDSTGDDYAWNLDSIDFSVTPSSTLTGDDADTEIQLGLISATNTRATFNFIFDNTIINSLTFVTGQGIQGGSSPVSGKINGFYSGGTPTSFEFVSSAGNSTGVVEYYELE